MYVEGKGAVSSARGPVYCPGPNGNGLQGGIIGSSPTGVNVNRGGAIDPRRSVVESVHLRDMIRYSDDSVSRQIIFASERLYVGVHGFKPGQETAPHVHKESDKVYEVLEGTGEFHLNGETRSLGAGEWLRALPGQVHGVRNPGPENLAVLVMTSPRRMD